MITVKGSITLLALVLALHVGIGCGVVYAAPAIEAPCCGQNCPMGSAVGPLAWCYAQTSGVAAQEIARPSIPTVQVLVSLVHVVVLASAQRGI